MGSFSEFFKDTGTLSMTRLLSFICVSSAVVIAIHAIIFHADLNATSILCGTFLGAGLGAKVMQSKIEANDVSGPSTTTSQVVSSRTSTTISNVAESGQNDDKK